MYWDDFYVPLEHCDSTVPIKGRGSSPSENDMTNPITSPNPHLNTLLSGAQTAGVHPRMLWSLWEESALYFQPSEIQSHPYRDLDCYIYPLYPQSQTKY